MAFTFQEFAIAWSQPPNKTRCTASWETTPCLAWSLPWQPSCCASWWLWSDGKKWCHVIIFMETLRKAGRTHFFGVSMAAWLDDLCQWWGGEVVRRLKGIITGGICSEEMLAQWSDDPMWFWNPAHLSQVGPGSWLRMVRDKNRTEEAQVFLGLWPWSYSSLFCCDVLSFCVKGSIKARVLNFHIHIDMKSSTISTCTDHEITLKELSWCAQAVFNPILPERIRDVGGTLIAHLLRFGSDGWIQGLAQAMTCSLESQLGLFPWFAFERWEHERTCWTKLNIRWRCRVMSTFYETVSTFILT